MSERTLTVAAVQVGSSEDIEGNATRAVRLLKECSARGAAIASFPEGYLYGYSCRTAFWKRLDDSRILSAERRIRNACRRYGIAAVVGSTHVEEGNRFNSLFIVDADGTARGRYGKIMLAGEKWCVPSPNLPVYSLCGVTCCFLICHDVRYPELVRLPAAKGAQICFFCSCESPLTQEKKLSAYRAMPISRATENGIYVVMANAPADPDEINRSGSSHGESKIIHPNGNALNEAGYFGDDIVVCELDLRAADGRLARRAAQSETKLGDWLRKGTDLVQMPRPEGRPSRK